MALSKDSEAVYREALERFTRAYDADDENRKKSKDDIEFAFVEGMQWDDKAKAKSAEIKGEIMDVNGKIEKFDIVNEQIRKFEQRIEEAAFIYRNYGNIVEETLKRIQ